MTLYLPLWTGSLITASPTTILSRELLLG